MGSQTSLKLPKGGGLQPPQTPPGSASELFAASENKLNES